MLLRKRGVDRPTILFAKAGSDGKSKVIRRGKDQAGSISPVFSGKKSSVSTSALKPAVKLFKKTVTVKKDDKKPGKAIELKGSFGVTDSFKRTISVPPGRGEDSTPPLTPTEAPGTPTTPSRKSPEKRGEDIGTRLFNQAIELETKRAEKRKSMEPDYPFTPRLAQQTPKWLRQRSAKPPLTMRSTRENPEEVAIVSSAAVFNSTMGRVGLMLSKGKAGRESLAVDVEFNSVGKDRCFSKGKELLLNTERTPFTGSRSTRGQASSFFESYIVERADSPHFRQETVMVDFEGEESCDGTLNCSAKAT